LTIHTVDVLLANTPIAGHLTRGIPIIQV